MAGTRNEGILLVEGITGDGGGEGGDVNIVASITLPVSVATLPLPTGASTSAKQDVEISVLANIDADLDVALSTRLAEATFTARVNTLGQKTMAGSMPVSIASDQGNLPVSGTFFQATQPISAVSLPLPTGAAAEATLAGVLTTTAFQARINTLGQKTMVNSTPVVLASDQASIPVTGAFFQATQPVSLASVPSHAVTGPLTDAQLRATAVPVSGTFWQATQPISIAAGLPAGSNNIGDVDVLSSALPTGASTSALQTTINTSLGTILTQLQGVLQVKQRSDTATLTNVNDSATSVTLLSANTSRLGAMIANDSTESLYVKYGTTASVTSFSVLISPGGYHEVPFGYTGRIDGIWSADGAGAARMTELT